MGKNFSYSAPVGTVHQAEDVDLDSAELSLTEDDHQSDGLTKNLLPLDFFAYSFTNSGLTTSLSESVPL